MPAKTIALAALTCLPLAAQSFVVDVANGPGTDYVSLADAIANVPDGAVITVRAGNYFEAISIDQRSLTIFGEPGSRIVPSFTTGFRIRNLQPQQSLVMVGLHVDFSQAADPTIRCIDNLGTVVLDDVAAGRANLWTESCAAVTVRNSQFQLSPSGGVLGYLRLEDSVVALENCESWGTRIHGGTVSCTDCLLAGATTFGVVTGLAVEMNGGELRIAGGSVASGATVPAIDGIGTVRLDPSAAVTGGTPLFAPGVTVLGEDRHAVTSTVTGGGASVTASAIGPDGALGIVVLGLVTPAVQLPGLDPLWIDPANNVVQAFGLYVGGVPIQPAFALPAPGAFPGVTLTWQSLALLPAGGLALSSPSMLPLH